MRFFNHFSKRSTFVISILVVLLTAFTTNVWGASPATLTFTAACGGSGTDSDGNTWTVTSDAAESTYDGTKGIHYGTSKKAVSYLNLTTSGILGTITSISVNASGASGTSAKLNVTVGGSAFGSEKSLTSTATSYSFTGSASGTIVVAITQSSAKVALYCKSISVTYSSGGSPTLSSISVKTAPTKTSYTEGEYFDPTGLVITRTYSDASTSDWTYASHTSDFTFTPSTSTALTTSNTSVTITYGGKSTTQAITVTSGGGGGGSGGTGTIVFGTDNVKINSASVNGDDNLGNTWAITTTETSSFTQNASYSQVGSSSNPASSITFTTDLGDDFDISAFSAKFGGFSGTAGTITLKIDGVTVGSGSLSTTSDVTVTATGMPVTGQVLTVTVTGISKGVKCYNITYTCTPATSYTITAVSNNDSWGTVSLTGKTITATPAPGYVAGGYTVLPLGSATVVQSGNTFTVTPSSDCTVQINFREAYTYTVTFVDNGGSYNETATEGVPYELPDAGNSTCEDATLLGWVQGTYTDHATGTSVKPDYVDAGASVNITANTTFTAVYGIVTEDASDVYTEITSADALKTGDYLIVADYSSSLHEAMANAVSSSHMNESSVTITDGKITTTNTTIRWHITKTGDNYTIYNAAVSKYLALSTTSPLLETSAHNFVAAYSAGAWTFESTTVSGYQLAYGTNLNYFESATSQNKPIKLYRRGSAIGSYTSKPHCCHAPLTALAISSETTNFIGSGSTTISLTGGNGKPITWSCKDEANIDRSSYLSGKSNTGATITLPTNAATKVYTVTATQADDETDPDNVICGATVTLNFTVKAQFTINFKTIDGGSESLYSSITVADGDSYEMPNIAEDFDCGASGKSFVGWASTNDATSVEKAAGANVTASASATWYACWSTGGGSFETVYIYQEVTNISQLSAGDKIIIGSSAHWLALGEQSSSYRLAKTIHEVEGHSDQTYFLSTDGVSVLTLGGNSSAGWTIQDTDNKYLYANSNSSSNSISTRATDSDNNSRWDITIGTTTTVIAKGSNSKKDLRYNNTTNPKRFTCYATTTDQTNVVIYKKTKDTQVISTSGEVSITTDHSGCVSGATIRATTDQWITAAKGQKVKRVYSVSASGFDAAATLTIASNSNDHFVASLANDAIPASPGHLNTTLTVEYTPTESELTESTIITLQAGDVTKTITVNGRSLPEEFLLITKKTLWYALPGNMNDGPGEYPGVEVTPNDGTTPTMVGVASSTVLYSLLDVTADRYDDNGTCVRLIGYNSLGLWSNLATSTTSKINIQNKTNAATATGDNFEWLLTTTDGIRYTIANPHHPQYGEGRRLAYGDKFGLYSEPTIFYIVTAGCTSQPQNVSVGARRVNATFSWVSNTTEMHIDLYTNEAMNEGHLSAIASSAPYVFNDLTETTDYWYKLTPGTDDACAVTGSFKTTGPLIDIVEWEENAVNIFVDKGDINPLIIIDGQEEHGSISGGGGTATELFFAKYFEGAGSMKLLSIFNGTNAAIPLSEYSIFVRCRGKKDGWSSSDDATLNLSSLGSIAAGQEIIFFTRPTEDKLIDCSDDFLDEKVTYHSSAESNPRWVECNGDPFKKLTFNGNDPILLRKNGVDIDIIGSEGAAATTKNCLSGDNEKGWPGSVKNMDYGKGPSDDSFDEIYDKSTVDLTGATRSDSINFLVNLGINLVDENINITTARCILFRSKDVTSGENAVTNNGSTFATFTPDEWNGRSVCQTSAQVTAAGFTDDGEPTCNSYKDIANMDYNEYYIDYTSHIDPGTLLDTYTHNEETKIYNIPIDNMYQYACLKVRFQLKKDDEVLTEAAQQVPIVVTGNKYTHDPLFSALVEDKDTHEKLYPQSVERCKTCNVVILSEATLTKGADDNSKAVNEIANLKIYPRGKLIVPSGTEYTVKSLAFRREEDSVSMANIQGTLNIGTTNGVYLDFRDDPTNWHYFSLPYNCRVSDIRFANEEETAVPVLGTDFLLKKYNGEKRAATQAGGCWEMVAPDEELKKGLGYIFALPGDGKVKREFRFPMSNDVITEDLGPKTIGQVFGYGCDKTDEELGPNHKGWNLIGDPYLMPYKTDFTNPLTTGKLVHTPDPWDGKWMIEDNIDTRSVHYIVEPKDNGWSEYRQVSIYEYPMKPFTCYFVQIGGSNPEAGQDIDFTAAGSSDYRSIVRRAPKEYEEVEDTHPVWCAVDLISPSGEKDETTLLVSDEFTDDYDMMSDLVKMRGTYYQYAQITTKPVLASRNNAGEMAFNALPDASAAAGVPLNFFAATGGEYTFAYNDKFGREEVKSVMLLDKQTNTWYDLMENNYSFSTNRIDDTERFILSVRVERKKNLQSITEIEDGTHATNGPRKILINGHVYILRDGKVYDITGKQMSNL